MWRGEDVLHKCGNSLSSKGYFRYTLVVSRVHKTAQYVKWHMRSELSYYNMGTNVRDGNNVHSYFLVKIQSNPVLLIGMWRSCISCYPSQFAGAQDVKLISNSVFFQWASSSQGGSSPPEGGSWLTESYWELDDIMTTESQLWSNTKLHQHLQKSAKTPVLLTDTQSEETLSDRPDQDYTTTTSVFL